MGQIGDVFSDFAAGNSIGRGDDLLVKEGLRVVQALVALQLHNLLVLALRLLTGSLGEEASGFVQEAHGQLLTHLVLSFFGSLEVLGIGALELLRELTLVVSLAMLETQLLLTRPS